MADKYWSVEFEYNGKACVYGSKNKCRDKKELIKKLKEIILQTYGEYHRRKLKIIECYNFDKKQKICEGKDCKQ